MYIYILFTYKRSVNRDILRKRRLSINKVSYVTESDDNEPRFKENKFISKYYVTFCVSIFCKHTLKKWNISFTQNKMSCMVFI